MTGLYRRSPFCLLAVCSGLAGQPALGATTELISERSGPGAISDDGRFVAFTSQVNLVPGVIGKQPDVFVRDRVTRTIEKISVSSTGAHGTGRSLSPSISANGRYVAFTSQASNLVVGDSNNVNDVFVRDRATDATERVSVSNTGAQANGLSVQPSISADGRYVAFLSRASNLVSGDTNFAYDAFVRDRQTGATERVSVASDGAQLPDGSTDAKISGDGRFVVFISPHSGVVPGDANGTYDVFVRDREALTTTRVSVDSTGSEANGPSSLASISRNGRFVVFASEASNLVADDTNEARDVFLHDRLTGVTERVNLNSAGGEASTAALVSAPLVSPDGRLVVFDASGSDYVPDDTNGASDVFMRDRQAETTERLSLTSQGGQIGGDSYSYAVSFNGRFVGLRFAGNVYLRDRGRPEPPRNDLLADFGAQGLFQRRNAGGFALIHPISPTAIAAGNLDGSLQDEAIASFTNQGLRARYNGAGGWRPLHATAPTHIVVGDFDGDLVDDLAGSFPGLGILVRLNNGAWVQRHPNVSQGLAVGDLDANGRDELIADRGGSGLWARYNNAGAWVQLNTANPLRVITADLDGNGFDEVIIDQPSGTYVRFNNVGGWQQLHNVPSEGLAAGDLDRNGRDDLLADRGTAGLWVRYSGVSSWLQLDARNPFDVATADLDNNGAADILVDRGASGLWVRYNNVDLWQQLSPMNPEGIAAADLD